jgi:phage-related minor tail protein
MEGVAPELVEGELAKLQIKQELTQFENGLNEAVKANNITQEEANQLLKSYTEAAQGAAAAVDQLTQANVAANDPINNLMKQWKTRIQDVRGQYAELAGTVASELSGAMSSAITGVIDGTTTVQEAFSQMFKNIGAAFISMATEMIAKALVMKVLGILGGGLSGGAGGGGGGGGWLGNWQQYAFASGGFVTGPTNALIGEGGSNEYVIPENKMGSAMAKWNAGARGDAVVNGADPTGGGGVAVAEAPAQINISGGVMQFNDTNYIRQDQIPLIISQAGKQGEQRALRKLQMNPGARRRIGL